MSQAAEAHDPWADQPDAAPQRPRRRREVESWASADDLEMLSGIGRPRSADWSVLTLERDEEHVAFDDDADLEAPRGPRIGARPALTVVEADREDDPYAVAPPAPGTRRTVVIRGRGDERQAMLPATNERRRPARRPSERVGHRPDRVAMYAVGLGLLLILVALLSAGGS